MSSQIESKAINSVDIRNLSDNLKLLMSSKNIDAAQLYEKTGIAVTTINNLRRGVGNPTLSTLQLLSEFFDVSIGELTETNFSSEKFDSSKANQEIPIFELQEVNIFLENLNKAKKTISVDIGQHSKQNCFAVKVSNNSMAPFFEKGTIFVICKNLIAQDGDIVLVKFNNHLPCFRKVFIEEDTYLFNSVSETLGKELSKSKNFTIHGVVIKAIQHFHE